VLLSFFFFSSSAVGFLALDIKLTNYYQAQVNKNFPTRSQVERFILSFPRFSNLFVEG
jgi:hypothetical protein